MDNRNQCECTTEKGSDMTDVTRWRVPEMKCTRRYGATLFKLFKNPELVLTLSAKGHALAFSVKSGLPRSPMGSGCAPAPVSVPQCYWHS